MQLLTINYCVQVQLEEGICIFCKSADAVRTAVPCEDRIVCTWCKNKMKGRNYKVCTECDSKIDDFVLFPLEKSDCPEMEKNYPPLVHFSFRIHFFFFRIFF